MSLPEHGKINCHKCFDKQTNFGDIQELDAKWRLVNNPYAWGSTKPKVIILGFSKGPDQNKIDKDDINNIPFHGSRVNFLGKILQAVNVLPKNLDKIQLEKVVDGLIADKNGDCHFGSLIRCSVQQLSKERWVGAGSDMLKFIRQQAGTPVTTTCIKRFYKEIPKETKLVLFFGLGGNDSNVLQTYKLFKESFPERQYIRMYHDGQSFGFRDENTVYVSLEHFSRGNNVPATKYLTEGGERNDKLKCAVAHIQECGLKLPLNVDKYLL